MFKNVLQFDAEGVEEQFCIGVPLNVIAGIVQFFHNEFHLLEVSQFLQLEGKVRLFFREGELASVYIFQPEGMLQEVDKVAEELLLVLTAHFGTGYIFNPFLEGQAVVGKDIVEPVTQQFVVVILRVLQQGHGFAVIAGGNGSGLTGSGSRGIGPGDEGIDQHFLWQGVDLNKMCAGEDGGQNLFLIFGYQYENGIIWWFFDQFEESVPFIAKVFGHPHEEDLVFAFKAFEAQLADDVLAFCGGDVPLFIFGSYELQPVVGIAVRMFGDEFAPFGGVISADWFVTCFFGDDRVGEVDIRVDVLFGFDTGRAFATGSFGLLVFAHEVLGKGKAKGEASGAFGGEEDHGVADAMFGDGGEQLVLDVVLAYDIGEKHVCKVSETLRKKSFSVWLKLFYS